MVYAKLTVGNNWSTNTDWANPSPTVFGNGNLNRDVWGWNSTSPCKVTSTFQAGNEWWISIELTSPAPGAGEQLAFMGRYNNVGDSGVFGGMIQSNKPT
ncbi:MAG: hypothetical protein AB8B56_09950 [Crocinitomicaceae bacterium]